MDSYQELIVMTGDPIDILVICSIHFDPLCIDEAKVIGAMHMIDNNERDDKIYICCKE